MTVNVSSYPFCAARLNWNFTRLDDPLMKPYWAAVIVADWCDDEEMEKFGGFDFNDRSDENGQKLLARLEQFLRAGNGKKTLSASGDMSAAEASVRSYLGANGVKVSKLDGLDDYWTAALTLWPDHVERKPKVRDIYTLRFQLDRIPKKKRPKIARSNLLRLPTEWCARGNA